MRFVELTHSHFGHKVLIETDKLTTVQQKFDPNTGESKTLVTYGYDSGHYVNESTEDIMRLIDGEVLRCDSRTPSQTEDNKI